ncbi:MAG: lipid biosynthetic enzyme, partial [Bacteroidota bacterium]|nr:lipid biosynthetic enzyme [Bacteroidota bacterium]
HPVNNSGTTDELFVDIGAYGVPGKANFEGNAALQELEQFVLENKGYQALYAKTLLSKDDLRKMFDHSFYDRLRTTLPVCEKAFGEVYDKVGGKARISSSAYRKKD